MATNAPETMAKHEKVLHTQKKKKKVKYSSTMRIAKKDWNTKKLMKIAWKRQTKIKEIHEGMQKKYLQK